MSAGSYEQIEPIALADIRARKATDLAALLRQKREQFQSARFALRSGQLQRGHVVRRLRKDMARIATVLGSMRRDQQSGGQKAGQV